MIRRWFNLYEVVFLTFFWFKFRLEGFHRDVWFFLLSFRSCFLASKVLSHRDKRTQNGKGIWWHLVARTHLRLVDGVLQLPWDVWKKLSCLVSFRIVRTLVHTCSSNKGKLRQMGHLLLLQRSYKEVHIACKAIFENSLFEAGLPVCHLGRFFCLKNNELGRTFTVCRCLFFAFMSTHETSWICILHPLYSGVFFDAVSFFLGEIKSQSYWGKVPKGTIHAGWRYQHMGSQAYGDVNILPQENWHLSF